MKATLPLLAAFALASCASIGTNLGPTARIGEAAAVGGFRIRPLEIVEDSRCPANAQCVWAGRLQLRAEVSQARFRQVRTLTLGQPQDVPGGKLTLLSVEPEKLAGPQPPEAPPRFTFAFE